MRSGTLPSPGRRIVLKGRVGRQQAVHLHPGDDVLVAPEAVLGLEVGGEQLEAGGDDHGADLDLELVVPGVRGRCSRGPGRP